jgi:hypothetical protein
MSAFINDVGSLSASTDFQISANYLITGALKIINQLDPGDDYAPPEKTSAGMISLNLLLKHMEGFGLQTWLRSQQSITLTNAKASYTLGPTGDVVIDRPIQVLEAFTRLTSTTTDIPLVKTAQSEFYALADKTSTGVPTQYTYFNTLTNTSISLYPVPDATVATNYTVEIIYAKPFDDIDDINNTLEVPPGMLEAIMYQLATRLAPMFKVGLAERTFLKQEADTILNQAMQSHKEDGDLTIIPNVGFNEGHI